MIRGEKLLHLLPSSSAKADDPVPDETQVRYALPVFTGCPPEPVIGLAEGETRWRGMTSSPGT